MIQNHITEKWELILNRRKFIRTCGIGAAVLPAILILGKSMEWSSVKCKSKPFIVSTTEVNGCDIVRIDDVGRDKTLYFSDTDNIDEKSFTEWADKENLHWDKLT